MGLEFTDLYAITTDQEVVEAIKRELKTPEVDTKVSLTKPNKIGQICAIVELNEKYVTELLNLKRIKIGWIYAKEPTFRDATDVSDMDI